MSLRVHFSALNFLRKWRGALPTELLSSAASRAKTEYRHPPALPFYHVGEGTHSQALTCHTNSL